MRDYILTFLAVFAAGALVLTAVHFPGGGAGTAAHERFDYIHVYDGDGNYLYTAGDADAREKDCLSI